MLRSRLNPRGRLFTALLGFLAAVLVLFIVLYPERAFRASLGGLTLWWELVFPALLPFLILSELATGFGFLQGLGVLLGGPLRLLFALPGAGGWAMATGLIAGYPGGAEATARLRAERLVSEEGAGKLLAVTHLCNPVTMVTVVGVGMLHSPGMGLTVAVIHYAAAIVTAVLLPVFSPSSGKKGATEAGTDFAPRHSTENGGTTRRALAAMRDARQRDGRTFGKLLGDAVLSSVQTLTMIGGFMMIFAVFNQVVQLAVPGLSVSPWISAAAAGLLEPHLGAFAFSQLWQGVPAPLPLAAIGAVLGWSGLSLHAQALSFSRGAGIRMRPFMTARCLHAGTAFLLTFALWRPLNRLLIGTASEAAAPSFAAQPAAHAADPLAAFSYWHSFIQLPRLLTLPLGMMALMLAAAAFFRLLRARTG